MITDKVLTKLIRPTVDQLANTVRLLADKSSDEAWMQKHGENWSLVFKGVGSVLNGLRGIGIELKKERKGGNND